MNVWRLILSTFLLALAVAACSRAPQQGVPITVDTLDD
jgi:hypothetical protein